MAFKELEDIVNRLTVPFCISLVSSLVLLESFITYRDISSAREFIPVSLQSYSDLVQSRYLTYMLFSGAFFAGGIVASGVQCYRGDDSSSKD